VIVEVAANRVERWGESLKVMVLIDSKEEGGYGKSTDDQEELPQGGPVPKHGASQPYEGDTPEIAVKSHEPIPEVRRLGVEHLK